MNEAFLKALVERIKADQMTINQVPEIFREEVQAILGKGVKTDV